MSRTRPSLKVSRAPENRPNSRPTAPLARTPLVPEAILKEHKAYCRIDTRFRAAARLLQAFWLKDREIPTGSLVYETRDGDIVAEYGSILDHKAAEEGRNFLTRDIYKLALRELVLREDGAYYDEDRLRANALSSMPLVFNIWGPLALDLNLATRVFKQILPEFVDTVEHVGFESAPARHDPRYLSDGTAFDVVMRCKTTSGELGTIFIEVKYSEDASGPAARHRPRYDEASRAVQLYNDPDDPALRSVALEQFVREHMVAQLAVDNGYTQQAVFLGVAPRLNRRIQNAFRVYSGLLIEPEHRDDNRVTFVPITLETLIEAISNAGAAEYARALWARYCDFERIYNFAISALEATADAGVSTSQLHSASVETSVDTQTLTAS